MRGRVALAVGMSAGMLAALSAVPAQANNTVVAGITSGLVDFAGSGVPPIGQGCAPTSFNFSGTAQVAGDTALTQVWVGAVGISGTGGSSCEFGERGMGNLTLSIVPYATLFGSSSLSCTNLLGGYTRVGTSVLVDVAGSCVNNGVSTAGFNIFVLGEFLPSGLGDGVTQPVTHASFVGGTAAVQ